LDATTSFVHIACCFSLFSFLWH